MQKLDWGGIRGKGIHLSSDVILSMVALSLATIVIILAYFVFERSAVKNYVEKVTPVVEKADRIIERADKLWDSDLLRKTPDPLTMEIDPVVMRNEAIVWKAHLDQDAKSISAALVEFDSLIFPPKAANHLASETGAYLRAANAYMRDARAIVSYLDELVLIEMDMSDAIRGVPYNQGLVDPAALRKRDAILAAELEKIKKLDAPKALKIFHEDTVQFLSEYLIVQQKTTAAYEGNAGMAVMEALGAEGEDVTRKARGKLRADVRTLKTGQLGRGSQKSRAHKQDTRDEINRLHDVYRF